MNKHKITTELFMFPHGDRYVIYAPFKPLMLLTNAATVNLLAEIEEGTYRNNGDENEAKVIHFLKERGILDGEPDKLPSPPNSQQFQPTAVTLFPTNQCNMRCIYCYASAGEGRAKQLSWTVARAAIDLVAENAKRLNQNQFTVGFHGGGEPTLPWSLFVRCVEYSKEKGEKMGLQVHCAAASNGVFTEKQLEWIVKHLDSMSISLDGPPDIQNRQRPLASGKPSFDIVQHTLQALDTAEFKYGLRSTITNFNVRRMKEIVDFFLDRFKPQQIQFEPLFLCGRCLTSKVEAPKNSVFITEFLKASRQAEKRKTRLTYSGLRLGGVTTTFCGACGSNFCVTPHHDVTSCFEVTEKQDFRSPLFFYGKWSWKTRTFEIWEDRRNYLLSFDVRNIPYCRDCIAKWHCAGDCLAKVSYQAEVEGDRGSERCLMNQEITRRKILQFFRKPRRAAAGDPPLQAVEKSVVSK